MLVRVKRGQGELHAQIAAQVRRAIADEEVARGDRLPAVRSLADSLAVNMHTVRRAYQDLATEGLIELRRGRGATVIARPGNARLSSLIAEVVAEAERLGLSRTEVAAMVSKEDA